MKSKAESPVPPPTIRLALWSQCRDGKSKSPENLKRDSSFPSSLSFDPRLNILLFPTPTNLHLFK
jgi:hypothetical protein